MHVVVEVTARGHLEVELADPGRADAIEFVDDQGQAVPILRMRADGYSSDCVLPLLDGKSVVVTVTSDGAEVDAIPVHLRPGQTERIRR